MTEDKLLPHIENLVPGFVTLWMLTPYLPPGLICPPDNLHLAEPAKSAVITLLVISAAYLIGVVAFAVSRFAVDTFSMLTFRWMLMWLFDWLSLFNWLGSLSSTAKAINDNYLRMIGTVFVGSEKSSVAREVTKRRERARLIRTVFIPTVLAGTHYLSFPAAFLTALFAVAFLYAYAEVTVRQEAKLATEAKA